LTTGAEPKKKRVVSGMRPTGRLHIGHYFGALQNWVRLQNDPTYECFYFIADWHALTSDYADTSAVAQNTIEIVTDYLAAGLDPQKSIIFLQSLVPEHAELHLLLSMVTPLGWLERVPTYKEALENIRDKDLHNYGFLGYPVLQCADIVIYSSPDVAGLFVPVGEDQVSHVETSREIVRRFNSFYGFTINPNLFDHTNEKHLEAIWNDVFSRPFSVRFMSPMGPEDKIRAEAELRRGVEERGIKNFMEGFEDVRSKFKSMTGYFQAHQIVAEPLALLTNTPRIPGLDGRKMSKSYGNAITLSETDEEIRKKTKVMVTDPARKRRTDPGNPDVCPVYDWHKLFSTSATLQWAAQGCRTAGIGCIECKAKMADHLIEWITPVRERRIEYEKHPARVLEVIDEGSKRARVEAQKTMARVREAVFGWEKKRAEIANT
jgi:tryptophanyl-tRNA synthetase